MLPWLIFLSILGWCFWPLAAWIACRAWLQDLMPPTNNFWTEQRNMIISVHNVDVHDNNTISALMSTALMWVFLSGWSFSNWSSITALEGSVPFHSKAEKYCVLQICRSAVLLRMENIIWFNKSWCSHNVSWRGLQENLFYVIKLPWHK